MNSLLFIFYFSFFLFRFLHFLFYYFQSHTVPFPCLTTFCLLPALSYFHCKFYFPPLCTLFLSLTLTISPPSIITKSFFLPLVSSQYFSLSCNIFILFPPLLIVACLVWIWQLLMFFNCIPNCSLFFSFKSHRLLSLSNFILLSSCSHVFEFGILFFPFLNMDSITYFYYFFSLYPLKIIFLYCRHLIFSLLFLIIFLFSFHLY